MDRHPVLKAGELVEPLTRRELEILALLAANRSNAEIAQSLSLALSSVKWYAQQIYTKLGVDSRRQAAAKGRALGLLETPGERKEAAADLPQHFPPLTTGVAYTHNLPIQLTSFIGREKEIASLRELFLLRQSRLVTLTGSGGTGKTRLALRTAETLLEAFPQGIWLVQLAPLSDPQLVPRAVAEALGVSEDPQRSVAQVLAAFLRDRQTLLILDNCEHVVGEASALAGQLLHACPRLRILATSREILGVEGEVPFRCPSLSLPRGTPTAGDLAEYEAVRLFIERAQTVSPGFALTEGNAPAIARISLRLDGIPLAIELAAARTRMLSPDQIAARLDHAFRLLTGGSRAALPRHQTLKALIDWSYNLLSPEERMLLLRLSVFAGGWSLEAAEQVCADQGEGDGQNEILLLPEQILDLLSQLIDKSLIQIDQDPAEEAPRQGEVRFRMLETVRQYAHERLTETRGAEDARDPASRVREHHLDYFLSLTLQAEPHLRVTGSRGWLDRLDRELDNLRLALEWSLAGSVEKGLCIAAALWWFWHIRNHRPEGVEWLERLLAADDLRSAERQRTQTDRIARGRALNALSWLAGRFPPGDRALARQRALNSKAIFDELGADFQRDSAVALWNMAETRQDLLACRQIFQTLGEHFLLAECDLDLTEIAGEQGDFDQEYRFAQESLALREELGDLDGMGYLLFRLSTVELMRGKPTLAMELANKSLDCFEAAGNLEVTIVSLIALHMAALAQGDYRQASEQIEKGIALGKDLSSSMVLVSANSHYAFAAWARQEYANAIQHAQVALEMAREAEAPFSWKKMALYTLGRVALSQGDYPRSRDYLVRLFTPVLYPYDRFINDFRAFHALGVLAAAQGQARRAALLFGAEEALCGWTLNMLCPPERSEYEQALAAARAALGEAGFAAAWEEGRAMTRDQARQYASEEY